MTCFGINNEGRLAFDYWHEDDSQLDGANIYNGATSTLWVNFKESFADEIQALYAEWRSLELLTYDKIMEYFIIRQSDKWSISVYNEDANFKYIEALKEENDSTYLYQIRGTGEEHLKYFIKNRLAYCDAKWCCGDYRSDYISLRIYTPMDENGNPRTDLAVPANPDITITPYSNTYAGIQFGAGSVIAQHKAEQNVPIVLPWTMDGYPNDLETSVFPASEISSLGDLSASYCGTVNVSKATKLTELVVGSGAEGYSNNNLTELAIGTNNLMSKIDVRNCPNLTEPLGLSHCINIQEIYATGSGITGVELPSAGYLKKVYLPGTLKNLTVTNQQYIEEFQLDGYDVLTTLRIENSVNIPVEDIMLNASNLNRIRLLDVQWTAESEEALAQTIEKFKLCLGLDENNGNLDKAIVTGRVTVPSISEELRNDIYNHFPDLVVDDGSEDIYILSYRDRDGTELIRIRVAEGASAYDPITDGPEDERINVPAPIITETYKYTFASWSTLPTNISRHYVIAAQYSTEFAIKFYNGDDLLYRQWAIQGEAAQDPIGAGIIVTPTKEGTDDLRYIFSGWDNLPVNVQGTTNVYAQFTNVYPVRFYAPRNATTPHHVQWVVEGEAAHDPSLDEGYTIPTEIIVEANKKKQAFERWDNIPIKVTSICNSYALYTIYWGARFWNGNVRSYTEWIQNGDLPVDPAEYFANYTVPTRTSTAQYSYVFNKWGTRAAEDGEDVNNVENGDFHSAMTASRDFYAVYESIIRTYNVHFYNDNTLLYTHENVKYGSTGVYRGATPTKLDVDNPEEYVFKGWLPLPEAITGETTCKALFKFTGYLFGKLAQTEEDDQGWGTVDDPNWDSINTYWETVAADAEACYSGLMSEPDFMAKYPIGGRIIIPIELSTGTAIADVEVIGYNHDDLADGSGKALITFFCTDLPEIRYYVNSVTSNAGGYQDSEIRTFVNEEIYGALPEQLSDAIKVVTKISDSGGPGSSTLIETQDYCWLASCEEVGAINTLGAVLPGQGTIYNNIFSNNSSRIKYIFNTTSPGGWWLRSSNTESDQAFWRVVMTGGLYTEIPSNLYYIAFGFCL